MGPTLPPVVRALLIICVAVFGLQLWLRPTMEMYFALWTPDGGAGVPPFRPWQLVTSNFLHSGWIHLAVNCMVIYSFGPPLEKLLGPAKFSTYFLVCAVAGSLLQLLAQISGFSNALYSLGASTGTSGLLVAFALAYPQHKIMVFPIPVPLAAWICVAVFAALSLLFALTGMVPGIGHFAHLGGMIGGFALVLYWRLQRVRR
ncbi:MAG: rhomboid family intramembrane serine protease [Steroidobacteraceae bacterium]